MIVPGDCRDSAHRSQPQVPVAIVGYSYRMPGGIRTDEDFWRLLSEREIVQEPIVDRYGRGYRPIGGSSGPGRLASSFEGLIRGTRRGSSTGASSACRTTR